MLCLVFLVKHLSHREDGPAVINPNGYSAWYKNGLRHREDGPAVIYPGGVQEWYIEGKKYNPGINPCDNLNR